MSGDGDVRYRSDVVGYPRELRQRMRAVEHQAALLVTARIRAQQTATVELQPSTLAARVRDVAMETRRVAAGQSDRNDLRGALVSLAATALICAEHTDRPRALGGTAPTAGILMRPRSANVVDMPTGSVGPRRGPRTGPDATGQGISEGRAG